MNDQSENPLRISKSSSADPIQNFFLRRKTKKQPKPTNLNQLVKESCYSQIFQNYGFYGSERVNINANSVMYKYSWTLEQKDFPNTPNELISPEFPNKANSGIIWYLTVKNIITGDIKGISVKLTLASCNVQNVNADYRFNLADSRGSRLTTSVNVSNKLFTLNEPHNTSEFIQLFSESDCLGLQTDTESVTICCKITVPFSEVYPAQYQDISTNPTNSVFQFADELQTMFENDEFSDVTFSIKKKELKAHKVVLAAGSSVFKVMFEHDMMEKKHNRVEITDVDFEVLRELIRYIYTKQVSNLSEIAKELLVAADKYDLEKLKNMCETVLCKNISTENVAEMFVFADTYNAVFLKVQAKDYIVGHSKDVSGTFGWKSIITTHPQLISEAFIALSDK